MTDLLTGLEDDVARQKRGTVTEEAPDNLLEDKGYLEALEAAADTFRDELTPESVAALRDEIKRVTPTLAQRVTKVMAAIDAVEKKGENKAQGYTYQRAVDVAREVRKAFIEHGLVLTTDIWDTTFQVIPRDNKFPMILVEVRGKFRLTDGVETYEFGGVGHGMDAGDKGVYKAITGMLKYGLRTLLLLPDERDDPEVTREDENEGRAINIAASNVKGVKQGGRQSKATTAQITEVRRRANNLGFGPDQLAVFIDDVLGTSLASEILNTDIDVADQGKYVLDYLGTLPFDECGKVVKALVEADDAADDDDEDA